MSSTTPRISSDNPSALPPGTRLGEFELLSLLGVGGFGIVYLAFDHALEREVAVKEYMPASLAGRTETMHVSLRSQNDAETFALGLRSFVNEAKMLARFDHPSLLKVHRFWEANGTAYMAMPVMRGRTLKQVRAEMTQPPGEAWLRDLLTPLLGAIEKLHSEGVYHRDIAPDNVQVDDNGHPVLLDFGAARRVIGDKSQTLTAILKPAYAPIEQYAEAGSVKQGPWTDIYALGATLHYLLLNRPPPPATARAIHDEVSLLSTASCAGCSENFLRTIDWMLAPRPIDRPQSVAALREVLDGHALPPLRRLDAAPQASQWDRTVAIGARGASSLLPAQPVDVDLDGTRIVPPPLPAAPASDATVFEPPLHKAQPVATPTPAARDSATAPHRAAPGAPGDAPGGAPLGAPGRALGSAPGRAPKSGRGWLPAALGVGLVAMAVAAFALWSRGEAVIAADAANAAASAAAAAAAALAPSAAATAGSTLPAAPSVPESTVATVVVPSTPAASPGAPTSADTAPATGEAVMRPPRPAAPARAAAPSRTAGALTPARSVVPSVATSAPAAPPSAQGTVPAATSALPPAMTEVPAAEPVKPIVARGPEGVCEGRNPVLYFVCMERECLRGRFQAHADCVKWRREARREVN